MATVSKPFVNASISPLKRALSWCPLSPTKIALVYVATTGGSPRHFVQIVNFVDGVPVYGPPCMILLQAVANTAPSMRICRVRSDRLLFSIPKTVGLSQAKSHSFVLCQLNLDDTVEFIAESATLVTVALNPTTGTPSGTLGLIGSSDGTATVYGNVNGTSDSVQATIWPLNTANDTVTIGTPQTRTSGIPYSPAPYESVLRLALDDKQWLMQSWQSGFLTIGINDGVTDDYVNLGGLTLSPITSFLTGFLPVRDDTYLILNGTTAQIRKLARNATSGIINGDNLLATLNWRNAAEVATGKVEDSIWLDADGTFVSAYSFGAPITPSDPGTSAETASTLGNLKLYIAKYNESGQSIQQAADFPLDLNVLMPKRNWDRMLHKVDNNTIAVIGAFCPVGQTNPEHGIIMVKGS